MDYGSSYAVGGPQLGHTGDRLHHAVPARVDVLPASPPQRMHWSTIVFVTGMVVCAIGLLATIAGVPGSIGYDADAPGARVEPDSNDPMAITSALDQNMKWVAEASSDTKGGYVGHIEAVNRNVASISAMVQALGAMDASVASIDAGLGGLGDATAQMGADMQAMADVSGTSGATMTALGEDIGFLSRSMLELADSTQELTKSMASIEAKASGIAESGTAEALKNTKALSASLPDDVPVPLTTDGEPLDQAMQRLAEGGGGSDGAVEGVVMAQ